jgi:hypothetical protein
MDARRSGNLSRSFESDYLVCRTIQERRKVGVICSFLALSVMTKKFELPMGDVPDEGGTTYWKILRFVALRILRWITPGVIRHPSSPEAEQDHLTFAVDRQTLAV